MSHLKIPAIWQKPDYNPEITGTKQFKAAEIVFNHFGSATSTLYPKLTEIIKKVGDGAALVENPQGNYTMYTLQNQEGILQLYVKDCGSNMKMIGLTLNIKGHKGQNVSDIQFFEQPGQGSVCVCDAGSIDDAAQKILKQHNIELNMNDAGMEFYKFGKTYWGKETLFMLGTLPIGDYTVH